MTTGGGPSLGASFIVEASIVVGLAALALTTMFLLVAIGLRSLVMRRQAHRRAIQEAWSPVLLHATRGESVDAPPLRRRDHAAVLELWNRLVSSIGGRAADGLVALARRIDLDDIALVTLRRGREADRLVAAVALGQLGDIRAVGGLRRLADTAADLTVRAEATRALLRIDARAGARMVVPIVIGWTDCHPATAVAVLREADHSTVSALLARQALGTHEPARLQRVIEMLEQLPSREAAEAVRQILRRAVEPEIVSSCLQTLRANRDPRDADLVAPFLEHPVPFVRVQAVATLGHLRRSGDQWRILGRLDDHDWWVRHRAAHAICEYPRPGRRFLELVSRVHPDRYARGALEQALTERGALR